MHLLEFLNSLSVPDQWVFFNMVGGLFIAVVIEFSNNIEKMGVVNYLKAALFFWLFGGVVGLLFGDSLFFASGKYWYQFLGSLLYVPAIIASFCAVVGSIRAIAKKVVTH